MLPPPLPRFAAATLLILLFAAVTPLTATTVIAPSFPELVAEAATIVRARVVGIQPFWAESPQGRVIKTRVTFAVAAALKGSAGPTLELEFLGGELDGHGLRAVGVPRFELGQSEILFVDGNRAQFCPLIGVMHGRYRVRTDPATGREYMARNDGVPLVSEHDVQLPQDVSSLAARLKPVAAALSPAAFAQRIRAEVQQPTRTVRNH